MYTEISGKGAEATKITLSVSRFSTQEKRTLSLLNLDEDRKEYHLSGKLQKLREKFGLDIIKTGNEL